MQDVNFILGNFTIPCVNVCFVHVLQKLSLVGLIVTCCRYFQCLFNLLP